MEEIVVEAYYKSENRSFFEITSHLEKLLKKYYSLRDARTWITTGEVRRILATRGLTVFYGF